MIKTSLVIAVLLVVSIFTRLYHLDFAGLTKDETVTLCVVNGEPATVYGDFIITADVPEQFNHKDIRARKTYRNVVDATIKDNGNAVAYNIVLSWWTKLFGNTNSSLRFLSLLFGVFTVILGYYFCRQLFNKRTANIAGLLLCLHPVLVEYGQLARSYVPATFLVLMSTYSLYQVAVAKRHVWLHIPLYVLSVTLSMLCHYLTAYIFMAHVLLVIFFHGHRKALMQYVIMGAVCLVLFSIWLFNGGIEGKAFMDKQDALWQARAAIKGVTAADPSSFSTILHRTGLNWLKIFGNKFQDIAIHDALLLSMLLIPVAVLFFVFRKVRKSEYFRPVMFLMFPLAMQALFTIFMGIRSGHTITYDIRYATFVMPFACCLLAFGLDRMMSMDAILLRVAGYGAAATIVLIMIISIYPQWFVHVERKDKGDAFTYHHAADFIEKQSHDDADTVIFHDVKDAVLTNIYINRNIPIVQTIDGTIDSNMVVIRRGDMKLSYPLNDLRY